LNTLDSKTHNGQFEGPFYRAPSCFELLLFKINMEIKLLLLRAILTKGF